MDSQESLKLKLYNLYYRITAFMLLLTLLFYHLLGFWANVPFLWAKSDTTFVANTILLLLSLPLPRIACIQQHFRQQWPTQRQRTGRVHTSERHSRYRCVCVCVWATLS